MTRTTALHFACIVFCALLLGVGSAHAQYLYLDSNGDGIHSALDVVNPAGTTTVDIWIDTDSNRDGSAATCPTQDGDLTINSYEIILRVTNGTLSWGTFTNRQADFTTSFGQASSASEYYTGFGGGVILPAGTYRLGTLEVSIIAGTPAIEIASSTTLGPVYLTSFGSRCSGNDLDNTLKLGLDWFDADGLAFGGVANQAPFLTQPADMELLETETVQQALTATDADGQGLSFVKVSGPTYMTVTTLDPGSGTASGVVTLAPTFTDAGVASAAVAASDGVVQDAKTFQIRVLEQNQLALDPIADVSVAAGEFTSVTATAFDPDHALVTFSLTTAPPYVYLVPTTGKTAKLHVSPLGSETGTGAVTLTASAGGAAVSQSFTVTVTPRLPCAAGWCASKREFPTLIFPDHVELTDFNDDGHEDIVVIYSSNFSVLPGLGRGVFGQRIDTPSPSSNVWVSTFMADYDTDGVDDLLGTRFKNQQYELVAFRGTMDGHFEPEHVLVTGPYIYDPPFVRDLDGDGNPDLLVAGQNGVALYRGLGGGVFGPPGVISGPGSYNSPVLADFNGDGIPDLASSAGISTRMMLGIGGGAFAAPVFANTPFFANHLAAGDMNGDGKLDLVAVSADVHALGTVLIGDGNGTFTTLPIQFRMPGFNMSSIRAADVTGDGVLDVSAMFTRQEGPRGATVIAGLGDGTFVDRTDYTNGRFGFSDQTLGDFDADGVADIALVGIDDPFVSVYVSRGYVPHPNRPPTIEVPAVVEAHEGEYVSFFAIGDDPDLDVPQFQVDTSALPPGGSLSVSPNPLGIFVSWSPPFGSIGDYPVVFRFTFGADVVTATTTVRVLRGNRPPVALAGGGYAGAVGVPIEFNAAASYDPDGDPLTYSWRFGDGAVGVGVVAQHAYSSAGFYSVVLVVSDGQLQSSAFTHAEVYDVLAANLSVQSKATISLAGKGSASTCIQIEPGGSYEAADILPATLLMRSDGTGVVSDITPISEKSGQIEDTDKDGILELSVCFRREDLRQLLSTVTGRDTVTVSVEGRLANGAQIQGTLDLVVSGTGGPLSAALSPNPLNPRATLSFVTASPGRARVEIFDVSGRRVNTLVDDPSLRAGYHEVAIEGRSAAGERLGSGVYFYRIEAAGEVALGRFTILK